MSYSRCVHVGAICNAFDEPRCQPPMGKGHRQLLAFESDDVTKRGDLMFITLGLLIETTQVQIICYIVYPEARSFSLCYFSALSCRHQCGA